MKFIDKIKNNNLFRIILFGTALLITMVSIFTGAYVQEKETIQIGMVSPQKYISPRQEINTYATKLLQDEAADSVGNLYKHDTGVVNTTLDEIDNFFNDIEEVLNSASEIDGVVVYNKEAVLKIPVALTEAQYTEYSNLSGVDKASFKGSIVASAKYVYEQGITEDSMQNVLLNALEQLYKTTWDSELKNMGNIILSAVIRPNLVLDEEAMNLAKAQKIESVEPVIIRKNQKIVDENEIITEEIYSVLVDLNLIETGYTGTVIPVLGSLAVVCILFALAGFYFKSLYYKKIFEKNEILILFVVYVFIILLFRLTSELSIYSVIPVSLFAMLIAILIDVRLAMYLNLSVCIIGLFIYNGGLDYLMYTLVTGTISALLMQYTKKRRHILFVACIIGVSNFLTYLGVGFFVQNGYSLFLMKEGLYAAGTGVITLIVVLGSLPMWEGVFDINTPLKLLELTNPNNELMRRLMIEAPGTYHHCLLVANLAETACYDIGADATLARVGAYYHDVGKLKYPLYFAENQGGDNPHDDLDPFDSARIIKQHIRYGLTLADENKLPKSIKSFIEEHHGTTLIKYFYHKAVSQHSKEAVNETEFRYQGPVPGSKETAVVMLADTIEAAVRSDLAGGKDLNQIKESISNLVKDKIDDGQLDKSNLTFTEIDKIKNAFIKVFQGMYHRRVAYPNMEEIKN